MEPEQDKEKDKEQKVEATLLQGQEELRDEIDKALRILFPNTDQQFIVHMGLMLAFVKDMKGNLRSISLSQGIYSDFRPFMVGVYKFKGEHKLPLDPFGMLCVVRGGQPIPYNKGDDGRIPDGTLVTCCDPEVTEKDPDYNYSHSLDDENDYGLDENGLEDVVNDEINAGLYDDERMDEHGRYPFDKGERPGTILRELDECV